MATAVAKSEPRNVRPGSAVVRWRAFAKRCKDLLSRTFRERG